MCVFVILERSILNCGCERCRFIALSVDGMNTIRLLSSLYVFCIDNMSFIWIMASSVHDHFGTYHFGTGFSPNSKFGPLRYMYNLGTCKWSVVFGLT